MEKGIEGRSKQQRLVNFYIGSKEYAVEIASVAEIVPFRPVTQVPEIDAVIEGVIELRGSVLPVIDLRRRFSSAIDSAPEHILIVRMASRLIGLVVDRVTEVFWVDESALHPAEQWLDRPLDCVKGVCKTGDRLILVLHLEKLWIPDIPSATQESPSDTHRSVSSKIKGEHAERSAEKYQGL